MFRNFKKQILMRCIAGVISAFLERVCRDDYDSL